MLGDLLGLLTGKPAYEPADFAMDDAEFERMAFEGRRTGNQRLVEAVERARRTRAAYNPQPAPIPAVPPGETVAPANNQPGILEGAKRARQNLLNALGGGAAQ